MIPKYLCNVLVIMLVGMIVSVNSGGVVSAQSGSANLTVTEDEASHVTPAQEEIKWTWPWSKSTKKPSTTTTTTTTTTPTTTTTTTEKPAPPTPEPTTTPSTTTPSTTTTTTPPTSTTTTTPPTSTTTTTAAPPTPPTTTTTTTTTAPPTTTPKPAPTPEVWTVKNATSGQVCIIANMQINLTVPYNKTEGSNITMGTSYFGVGSVKEANASGICGDKNQSLVLSFGGVQAAFLFKSAEKNIYSLENITFMIPVNNMTFPNHTANWTVLSLTHDGEVFKLSNGTSWTCAHPKNLALASTNNTVKATLALANVKVEAFGVRKTSEYSKSLDCTYTPTADIVPVVVGLVLAGLVVIVLVAYLVGRRRASARGYVSM